MPALVANYQKKVFSTRIAKFYSVMKQAYNAKIAEDGALDSTMITKFQNNADEMEEFFNVNYKPYIKVVSIKQRTHGVAAGFPDGSGMYVYARNPQMTPLILWCPDYKKCLDFDEVFISNGFIMNDGKNTFYFDASGNTNLDYLNSQGWNRDTMLEQCARELSTNGPSVCSSLLQVDNWEVKDDYPRF